MFEQLKSRYESQLKRDPDKDFDPEFIGRRTWNAA